MGVPVPLPLLMALALVGCAELDKSPPESDARIASIASETPLDLTRNGVAFMSLGSLGGCLSGVYEIGFRPVAGPQVDLSFREQWGQLPRDSTGLIESPQSCVRVVGMTLPPGEYRISGADWSSSFGGLYQRGTLSVGSTREIAVPFTVWPGEITYLGSFQMAFAFGKNFAGTKIVKGGEYVVADEAARDSEKLRSLRPELTAVPVRPQVPPEGNGTGEFPRVAGQVLPSEPRQK